MKKLRTRIFSGLAVGFVVVLILMLAGDIRQVGDRLADFAWIYLPLILACTLFNYTLRFFKWHYYLKLIGADSISMRESARLFVAGFPLAITPGKAGEALKGVWLHQLSGTPVTRGITVVLAERISDGLAVLLLSTLGVIAYPQYWPAFLSILGVLLAIIIISQIRPLALTLIQLSGRIQILKRISGHLLEFYEASYVLFRPRPTLVAVTLGTVSWLGEGIAMYLVLVGLGVPTGWETFSIAVFVLAFSTVIGAVSTLPGGLGAAEASIAGMLILILQLSVDISSAATLLIRLFTLWFGVGLGLIAWTFSPDLLSGTASRARASTPTGQTISVSDNDNLDSSYNPYKSS